MQPSIAITEFQIRRPLLRDIRLDSLPPELQETAADLLCTIIDAAALTNSNALEALRGIASKLAPKTTRKDAHQSERSLVTQLLERARESVRQDVSEIRLTVRGLIDMLGEVDPAFNGLDRAFVERALRERSLHKLAAILTIECGAFGESSSLSGILKKAAIDRVKQLSLRAQDA